MLRKRTLHQFEQAPADLTQAFTYLTKSFFIIAVFHLLKVYPPILIRPIALGGFIFLSSALHYNEKYDFCLLNQCDVTLNQKAKVEQKQLRREGS